MTPASPRRRADPGLRLVVVELFSSEGCSSCPPAEALLSRLVQEQPIEGAHLVGLELHVDYWDDLGWKDPFSRAEFTGRQRRYAERAGRRGAFTPEAVVGGRYSTLGSDRADVLDAIRRSLRDEWLGLALRPGEEPGTLMVALEATPSRRARLELFVSERGLSSTPSRGENRGVVLRHAPVVRHAAEVADRALAGEVPVVVPPAFRGDRFDSTVILRDDETLAILGAARLT